MLIMNAHILHSKFATEKLKHVTFREVIAKWLIASVHPQVKVPEMPSDHGKCRLKGRHFLQKIPCKIGKPTVPLSCKICSRGKKLAASKSLPTKITRSSFHCKVCKVALHVDPCFELYHTKTNHHDYV